MPPRAPARPLGGTFRPRPVPTLPRPSHGAHMRQLSTANAPRRAGFSTLAVTSLAVVLSSSFYLLGALRPPGRLALLHPPTAPPSPSATTPEGKEAIAAVERELGELEAVKEMRRKVATGEWKESRPYSHYPEEKRRHALTAGALSGPGKFAVLPLVFTRDEDKEAVIFIHVGRGMCGHDGIIHGGLSATIADEGLARVALPNLPSKIGVTAWLTINYLSPLLASQFVVFRSRIDPDRAPVGRKCWAKGTLETLDGKEVVRAEALFVQPRGAGLLSKSTVREALDS